MLHTAQRGNIPHGIVAQIQIVQILGGGKICNGGKLTIGEGQLCKFGQRCDDTQIISGYNAVGNV